MKKKMFLTAVIATMITLMVSLTAFAEGSKEIHKNGEGNRAYTEWDKGNYTAKIERIAQIKIYAMEGETLYLGSSVPFSVGNKDIVLIDPNGNTKVFDVVNNGVGLIDSYEKEQNGPNYGDKTGGYTPLEYKVTKTGIYSLEFHCPDTDIKNPKFVNVKTILTDKNQSKGVAAWDATLVGTDGEVKNGRVFTSYLPLNLGGNNLSLNSSVYILTKDGYIYNVAFSGIDPYGFIMYANNRGFVDATTQRSLYKNGISAVNEMTTMFGNVIAPNPNLPDTDKSYTHYIFFNEPAKDLPDSMPIKPLETAKIDNFGFDGKVDNQTVVGSGGVFNVDFTRQTTYQLIIDTNKDGAFDGKDVIIEDAASKGLNKIVWDGKDAEGKDIPAGNYDVKLYTKGGEYHFPLIDVENNPGGIEIQLLNDQRVTGDDAYTVYYDNTSYTTDNGTFVNTNSNGNGAVKPAKALAGEGINSKDGAFKFTSSYGDQKAVDVWTYTRGGEASSSITIVDGEYTGIVTGDVFIDTDKDKLFGANESGFAGISVKITCSDGTVIDTVTDSAGKWNAIIPSGKYSVEVISPDKYIMTSDTNKFSGEITKTNKIVYCNSVGYVKEPSDVKCTISVDKEQYLLDSEIVYNVEIQNTTDMIANGIVANITIPINCSYVSDTSEGLYNASTAIINIPEIDAKGVVKFTITVKADKVGKSNVEIKGKCVDDAIASNNNDKDSYMVVLSLVSFKPPYELNNNYAYIYGYNNTEMAADNNMKIGECSAVLYRLLKQNGYTKDFNYDRNNAPVRPEFAGRWDRSAAEYMIHKGVFSKDNIVSLDGYITRKSAFKLIAIALGFTDDTSLSYNDYAAVLFNSGYITGDADGNLHLDDYITRSEFCKIYNMIIGRDDASLKTADGIEINPATYGFEDFGSGDWYYGIMLRATSAYDDNGNVDIERRNQRNVLDDYE